jgi:hypothetical protein
MQHGIMKVRGVGPTAQTGLERSRLNDCAAASREDASDLTGVSGYRTKGMSIFVVA